MANPSLQTCNLLVGSMGNSAHAPELVVVKDNVDGMDGIGLCNTKGAAFCFLQAGVLLQMEEQGGMVLGKHQSFCFILLHLGDGHLQQEGAESLLLSAGGQELIGNHVPLEINYEINHHPRELHCLLVGLHLNELRVMSIDEAKMLLNRALHGQPDRQARINNVIIQPCSDLGIALATDPLLMHNFLQHLDCEAGFNKRNVALSLGNGLCSLQG